MWEMGTVPSPAEAEARSGIGRECDTIIINVMTYILTEKKPEQFFVSSKCLSCHGFVCQSCVATGAAGMHAHRAYFRIAYIHSHALDLMPREPADPCTCYWDIQPRPYKRKRTKLGGQV